ncbi:metal ABC transporter solute-binding protein, Zn/Mn family [Thiocystis violascens]|uniref:High-affinity zinc uptake system protein ZnuA n=1 Tax=Thiocystis violascens (strain ATCC 17096 / DSM 198 / 6111) TaxID=765911 RepID=I3YBT5_THIV6|nr:zinc ABC transporter substrate-binding protein [Thiocystis violascens]AFL74453.1 ABC-type metal ion transport system, periplasmic component/surface adhesin [Thiocystis violascens DSM 198]
MRKFLLCLWLFMPLAQGSEPLRVFVSVLPQQTFVERIGGSHVVVESMVKPGFSPHTYEPTPSQIARLAGADLYVSIGVPFEDAWAERIRATNPRMRMLDAREGIPPRAMEAHDHDEGDAEDQGHAHEETETRRHDHETVRSTSAHADSEQDPHIWTSPILVKRMAVNLQQALADLDPTHASEYQENLAAFTADLDALDRDIRAELAGLTHRRFMVFHPAWGYFAEAYELEQIPIEKAGKEPGPRSLAALIDQARLASVRVIFVQPQFPLKSAEQVAKAIAGRVEVIDPLSPEYFENLRRVARVIAESEG